MLLEILGIFLGVPAGMVHTECGTAFAERDRIYSLMIMRGTHLKERHSREERLGSRKEIHGEFSIICLGASGKFGYMFCI